MQGDMSVMRFVVVMHRCSALLGAASRLDAWAPALPVPCGTHCMQCKCADISCMQE